MLIMDSLAGELGPKLSLLYQVVHFRTDCVLCTKVPSSSHFDTILHSKITLTNFGAHITASFDRVTGDMIIGRFELNDPNFLDEVLAFLHKVHPMSGYDMMLLSKRNFPTKA